MAKSAKELQAEFDRVSAETQKAYDVLHPTFGSDARQIAYEYEKAVKEKDSKAIKELKPLYDSAQAKYKEAQTRKNALRKELKSAQEAEKTVKEKSAEKKSGTSLYDKAVKDLAVAEAGLTGYQGEQKYIDAYRKAEAAFKTLTDSGVTPKVALPVAKIAIPVAEEQVQLDANGKPVKEPSITEFIATITKPENKALLIDVQKDLRDNFGYKGPVDGKPSSKFMPALQKAYTDRAGLPEAWRGTDFRTFLSNPGVEGTSGTGTGTGSQYDPYGTLSVWDKVKTKSELTTLFDNLGIDRDPTAKEVNDIYAQIDKKQKEQKATVTKYKMINGVRTAITTPGFNQSGFVTDLVKDTQEYKDIVAKKAKQEESKNLVSTQALQSVADKNGITLSPEQLSTFADRVKKGEDVSIVGNDIRKLAGIGQPESVKKLIDSGIDLSTIYSPYKNILASTLEINPNTITLNDPTLRMAIGPDKEMSLYEYQRALRKDNRWQYTDQARGEASDVAKTVLKDFGFMG
jgi:hypothetical protein